LLKGSRSSRIVRSVSVVAILLSMGCGIAESTSKWKVVVRENPKDLFGSWVNVVLEHDGHRYFARCNNNKAGSTKGRTYGCGLHVGDTVKCQWYRDREQSKEYKGYDLICGDKRNEKGELDTFGENELLQIEREEK